MKLLNEARYYKLKVESPSIGYNEARSALDAQNEPVCRAVRGELQWCGKVLWCGGATVIHAAH